MNIIFSIITVVYNAEKQLIKTIQSILSQSYPHIEYIIIDGHSTDGTQEIIRKYEHKISTWISEPDSGLYDAMNKGLQKATGDYVWFLNAGDVLKDKNTVADIAGIVTQHNILPDILYGETDLVNEKGDVIGERRLKTPEHLTWKSFRMGMLVSHQAFIAKRSIAPMYDLQYRFSSDVDWCIKCLKQASLIINVKRTLVNYLYEGLTTANRQASLKERYAIMCKYYGRFVVSILHVWFALRFYWAKWTKKIV